MSEDTTPNLHTLPVELFYRILDYTSLYTILWSTRNVCMRIKAVVDTYQPYKTLIGLKVDSNYITTKIQYLDDVLCDNTTRTITILPKTYAIDTQIYYLAHSLAQNTMLTTLKIQRYLINDIGAQQIANALRQNTTLRILNLRTNKIGNEGAIHLAYALQHNITLAELCLEDNEMNSVAAKYLAIALDQNTALTRLDIGLKQTSEPWKHRLSAILKHQITLTTVRLIKRRLDDVGAEHLANALKRNNAVTSLDLKGNQIGPIGTQHLANMLKQNTSLTTLSLHSNKIGHEGAEHLANALKQNNTLTLLNLASNEIHDTGAQHLSIALKENTKLRILNLSKNRIGPLGVISLTNMLRHNTTLTFLNIEWNQIGDEGTRHLAEAFKHNKTLTDLKAWDWGTNHENKQIFKRACLLRRSHLSSDVQTLNEAYYTLLSHHSIQNRITNSLIRKESTTQVRSDREQTQQNLQLLPMISNTNDRSMELFREIMINGDNGERDFKEMVEEFVQLIENKLSNTEIKMFDANTTRSNSPSLFDMLNDLKTCLTLLRRTEIQSLLNVFDNVLKLNCYPSALPENDETIKTNSNNNNTEELIKLSQYTIDKIKLVEIEKTHQPLGLTISRTDSGEIHIARIVVGGLAATTQLFQINDRILEINNQPITGHSLDSICTLISNTTGLMKFLLAPPINSNTISYQTFHVRALYTYDPYNDPLIPCKELGLTFQRGDILRIVARDENFSKINSSYISWWQAYRENINESETDISLAGLIPSDNLQQKRSNLIKIITDETDSISSINHSKTTNTMCFTCRSSKHEEKFLQTTSFIRDINENEIPTIRTSTNHFSLSDTRQFDDEKPSKTIKRFTNKTKYDTLINSFHFYEPVFQLDIYTEKIKRPIVLLGASNVGRHELRRRLLQNDFNLFDLAIPHTTRVRRLEEMPDIDYHFVSEADFLAKVACHSFIEFGQYNRDLYGTSIDDIRYIVETKGKICILNLNPDAIQTFNKTNLYPYIIFISAPSIERLKRLELDRRQDLTEKDYRDIIQQSRLIEKHYAFLFDKILINNDLERTYIELKDLIIKIQHDNHQWVRASYRR